MTVAGTNVFYCIIVVQVYLRRKFEDLALSLVSDIRNCWQGNCYPHFCSMV